MNDYYAAPPDYVFEHPCGHLEKIERFFYDPKHPEPKVLVVPSIEMCKGCNCFFVHGLKKCCQGIEIVEYRETNLYIKE